MMSDPIKASAHRTPDAPALDDGTRVWSYAELNAAVDRMARRLVPLGVEPGETVALVAHPDASAIQAVHAVPRAGATLALLNPGLGAAGIEAALEALAPSLVLSTAATMAGDSGGLDPAWITLIDELPPADANVVGLSDESRFRLWTSGTAGRPTAVDLTVANLNASGDAVIRRLGLSPDDRWYASLSIAHVGGLALVWRAAMVGCLVVATGRYRSEELGALLTFGRATHASLVPTQLRRLLDRYPDGPTETVRCLLVGGAALPDALLERALEAGYPMAVTYGLTQATSQVATAPPELVREAPGTVGFPLDGLEVHLAADGEILVRGSTIAPGAADSEGWLSTGDLARMDDLGRIWITGRKSHRIVSGGVNVDPVEVEEALQAIPGVTDAVVVGLPDDVWGEQVAAVVVTDGSIGDADEVTSVVADRLSKAALPRRVRLVEHIPRNANGKADLGAVRALLER
jgi:o-succinylbenzoate---CoA ligase